MCFTTAILSYNMMWYSLHLMSESDFLYSSSAYHLESIVGWLPCFPVGPSLAFDSHGSTSSVFQKHRAWFHGFSFCGDVDVLLQGASVVFSLCGVPSTRWHTTNFCTIHWRTIVKVSLGGFRAFADLPFFQHLFRLVVHSFSFRRAVFGSTTAVFLDHISRD